MAEFNGPHLYPGTEVLKKISGFRDEQTSNMVEQVNYAHPFR